MIDEADEFVTGPQNKKRAGGDPNLGSALKRRRSMSPLLRRPQIPPIITNHVLGKGPAGALGQAGPIKPIPLHKGGEEIRHLQDRTEKSTLNGVYGEIRGLDNVI